MLRDIIMGLTIFSMGFLSCILFGLVYAETERPLIIGGMSLIQGSYDAPGDWIKESQIHVNEDSVVIDIEGASIGKYTPTGSMKPILDEYSNGIRIVPENPSQIEIGDIITFEQNEELIIHRVIEKGFDENGAYFITKGDNNTVTDGKIRFRDVKYVTVAILW